MKTLLLATTIIVIIAWCAGCAGTGEGGAFTPEDARAAIGVIDQGLSTYDHAAATYHGSPYQPYP